MTKRSFILAVFIFLSALFAALPAVSAQCCVSEAGGCQPTTALDQCADPSAYRNTECSLQPECAVVCCATNIGIDARYTVSCPQPWVQFLQFAYTPTPDTYTPQCEQCTQDVTKTCPDSSTITMAQCVAGKLLATAQACPTQPIVGPDMDNDGVPDSADQCPSEPRITTIPPTGHEIVGVDCTDGIDNDCDGLTDYADDLDCKGACVQDEKSTCPDGTVITTNACVAGRLTPTGRVCPGILTRPTGTCGDGIVQTPNEAYVNEDCEEDLDCGSGGICITASSSPSLQAQWPSCSCYYTCDSDPGKVHDLTVDSRQGINNLRWTAGASPACSMAYYDLYRCETDDVNSASGASCDPQIIIHREQDSSIQQYSDQKTTFGMTYCYKVAAHYHETGTETSSAVVCASTGDEMCALNTGKFCSTDKTQVLQCTANRPAVSAACASDEVCMESSPGLARCVTQNACDQCNSLFRIFGIIPGFTQFGRDMCNALSTCALDRTKTTVDQWHECSEIQSCYDYASKEACTDNRCSLTPCEWQPNPATRESGAGVCRPQDKERQECSRCLAMPSDVTGLNPKFNRIFNTCDSATCPLYGDSCFFADGACQEKEGLGCRAYGNDPIECVQKTAGSPQNATFNVAYSTYRGNIIRYHGENLFGQRSDDRFSYGTCVYQDSEGCFKDADDNHLPDCGAYDRDCEKDNEPPATLIKQDALQQVAGNPVVGRIIDLPLSLSESAKTYYCIVHRDPVVDSALAANETALGFPSVGGQPPYFEPAGVLPTMPPKRNPQQGFCYPVVSTSCRIQQILPEDSVNGDVTLYYYSEDDHRNIEPLNKLNILLDTTPPHVTVSHRLTGNDLAISMTLDEEAVCFAHLESEEGIEVRASPDAVVRNTIEGEKDTEFSRSFYTLPDGRYYWKYECKDKAGNARIDRYALDVDTNDISNPQPHGPLLPAGNVAISVTTKEEAECHAKEKTGLIPPPFETMDPMSATNHNTYFLHELSVQVGCAECYKAYDVKCKIKSTGEVQGDAGDEIRFAIDSQGPRMEVYGDSAMTVPFDADVTYGDTQTLFLRCIDDSVEQATGIKNFDSGCSNITLALPMGTPFYVHDETAPIGPVIVDKPATIGYTALDHAGQSGTGSMSVLIDNSGPQLDVDVFDIISKTTHQAGDTLGPGDYIVRVRSNSFLKDASVEANIIEANINLQGNIVEPERTPFEQQFHLPFVNLAEGTYTIEITVHAAQAKPGAKCTLEGTVIDTQTSVTLNFVLDTITPEITLEPLLDGVEEDGITDFQGYGVRRYDTTHYTNRENIFVTGRIRNQSITKDILFFAGQRQAELRMPAGVYDVSRNNADSMNGSLHNLVLSDTAPAGTNALVLNAQPAGFFANKYVYLGHDRTRYGKYHDFYKVKMVSGDTVILTEALEQDVPMGFAPRLFDKPHPMNWFGENLSLKPGLNRVMTLARSHTGVESKSLLANVMVDPYPPEVIASSPRKGSTNRPVEAISFRIKKLKDTAMPDNASLLLTMNGEEMPMTITSMDAGIYVIYNITSVLPLPITSGRYDIVLSGNDRAGNALSSAGGLHTFTFSIDDGLPAPPMWDIPDAAFHEGIWYLNRSPSFTMDFTENEEQITIRELFLQLYGTSSPYGIRATCTEQAINLFACTPLLPIDLNRAYEIIVEAYKEYPEAPGPTGSFFSEPVVLDNTPPEITLVTYKNPTAEKTPLAISVTVPNERFPLKATWHYFGDNKVYSINMTGNDQLGNYVFTWPVPDYSLSANPGIENQKPVFLSISDYSGNGPAVWNGTIKIDMVPPNLAAFTFNPQVEYANRARQEYYTKKLRINITGSFSDNDITAISIEPGNWMRAKNQYQLVKHATLQPDKTYSTQLVIAGEFNQTRGANYTITIEDSAGNKATIPFKLFSDLQPPAQPQLIFT